MFFKVVLIIVSLGGLAFAQSSGTLAAPENFVPPAPGATAQPAQPQQTAPQSAPSQVASPQSPNVDQTLQGQKPAAAEAAVVQSPAQAPGAKTPSTSEVSPAAPKPSQTPAANVPPAPVPPGASAAPVIASPTSSPLPSPSPTGAVAPPPRDQGLKLDDASGTIPPQLESEFRAFRMPKPFDFESATSYDETVKRDIFYYRGISDLYRRVDPTAGAETMNSKDRLTQYDVDSFEVLGIMWDVARPKAIIRDPLGSFHNLVKGMKIGINNGSVVGIREGEVIVMEYVEEEDRVVKKPRVMVIKNKAK